MSLLQFSLIVLSIPVSIGLSVFVIHLIVGQRLHKEQVSDTHLAIFAINLVGFMCLFISLIFS